MPIFLAIVMLVVLIYSAILHEIAHGLVAERLGDPTARLAGRLTLNPKNHIDPYMSILLPLLLVLSGSPIIFGAAKPVPIDPFNLRDGRRDVAIISLAGPLTNVCLAVTSALIIRLIMFLAPILGLGLGTESFILQIVVQFLLIVVQINILLAIFNLIPIPPLDGSKIFALLLPEKEASVYLSLGSVGFIIILFLLLVPLGSFSLNALIFNLLNFSEHLLGF
jgi:Zn-dependent protease